MLLLSIIPLFSLPPQSKLPYHVSSVFDGSEYVSVQSGVVIFVSFFINGRVKNRKGISFLFFFLAFSFTLLTLSHLPVFRLTIQICPDNSLSFFSAFSTLFFLSICHVPCSPFFPFHLTLPIPRRNLPSVASHFPFLFSLRHIMRRRIPSQMTLLFFSNRWIIFDLTQTKKST